MRVLIFGATGMIGQCVLREALADPGVTEVVSIGRNASGVQHAKLRDLVQRDLHDYSSIENELTNFDACFFCLGVASAGMNEADYDRITRGIAVAAAGTLVRLNPQMTFVFISGSGADSTEKGRIMWARVKGRAENEILRMPFKGAYVIRPAFVQPPPGIESRTPLYRVMYKLFRPLFPLIRRFFPNAVTTGEQLGQAMLKITRNGAPVRLLHTADVNRL